MSSASYSQKARPLSQENLAQRQKLSNFLDTASEDEFTERVLVPLFQRLGFHRVSPSGHTEKALEFGKDLWMKYQLPTSHWIYFCAQIKRDKIDASGAGGNSNVATVLNQARMAIDHPIFDSDTNRKVLLDHLYLISAERLLAPRGHGLWNSSMRVSAVTSFSWIAMNSSISQHASCLTCGLTARWPSQMKTFRFRWLLLLAADYRG